ncbi:MAG TPA: excinuclease ABC subunit C, partial [Candidatus Wallbacteria bacterium]|nr:excinuclease ABC subunit C [Candidatus Wallbacteria bacterium]
LLKTRGRKKVRFRAARDSAHSELVATAHKNALNTLKIKEAEIAAKSLKSKQALSEIQAALRLKAPPERIECYDISNISGTLAVGSMVVAMNGSMQRSEYRKFKIRTVDKIDDYMMMKEVLNRRFTRAIIEGQRLPDLVMIDGGLGHLSAACEAMSGVGLNGKVALCSIAKQNEDIYEPANALPVFLNKKSQGQYLLMRIRDEAHRFAIGYHKTLRKGKMTLSLLSEIKGLGKARIASLYDHFETIERMRAAGVDELALVNNITKPIAQKIYDYFHGAAKSESDNN